MREIKVRAWDKERKQFLTSPNWAEFQVNINGVLSAKNFPPPHLKGEQQLEIMQYIGLKDGKGKEIYEGDILRVQSGAHDGKVLYTNNRVEYSLFTGFYHTIPAEMWTSGGKVIPSLSNMCEVIGNIYEDSDKLGQEYVNYKIKRTFISIKGDEYEVTKV